MTAAPGLPALEARLRHEQELFAYPDRPWVSAGANPDGVRAALAGGGLPAEVDVLVVGAGQSGLTAAAKLLREGVPRVLVVDEGRSGAEGPWVTWARMETLRTVKDLHGPDLGHPAATFRSWYSAQHGEAAWDELGLIPREDWMAYLTWIRRVFAVPVANATAVTRAVPADGDGDGDGWLVTLAIADGGFGGGGAPGGRGGEGSALDTRSQVVRARRLLVCTGISGVGGPSIPAVLDGVPRHLWSHSSEALPPLTGARVAVLGVGASAFDNTAALLEAGAAEVVQFGRRPELPTVNSARLLESRGLYRHFSTLPDDVKVALTRAVLALPMPPPEHSVARCLALPGYELRLGDAWEAVAAEEPVAAEAGTTTEARPGVVVTVGGERERFDHLVLGTGFTVDLRRVPWLSEVVDEIALWGDRHPLEGGGAVDATLARYPYLDAGLAAQGRTRRADRHLRHLHLLNAAALASAGSVSVGINALAWGTDRVVDAITASLLQDEVDGVVAALTELTTP